MVKMVGFARCLRGASGAWRRARGFARDEGGSLLIFALVIFTLMLVASGMAIDFMRFENTRTRLQATIDRSILAAAAIEQPLVPEDVVRDYFAKSGLKGYDLQVLTDEGLNYRTVTAGATTTQSNYFLKLIGIDTLSVPAVGQADERVNEVEISLVLDVSGSMSWNNKLRNLKTAAKQFIDVVLTPDNEDKVSVSIVPFSTQVTAGSKILSHYNVSKEHLASHCVDFSSTDFSTTAIPVTKSLQRTAHFDPFTYSALPISAPVCPTDASREILAFSQDAVALKKKIDSFSAYGNTSIDIGMKWGAALLDPSAQPVVSALVASGDVDPSFDGRPLAFTDPDVLKVAVVMTDGAHTTQYMMNKGYYGGQSDVWFDSASKRFSIWSASKKMYWVPDRLYSLYGSWSSKPYGKNPYQMSYPELWSKVSVPYHAYYNVYGMTRRASDYYDWYYKPRTSIGKSTKDARLASVCQKAKDNGVVVFAIAFEISSYDAQTMRKCASSDAHFYHVQGIEIAEAFNAIAKTINQLRLTH